MQRLNHELIDILIREEIEHIVPMPCAARRSSAQASTPIAF